MAEWVSEAELIVYGTLLDVQEVGLFEGWLEDGSVATVTPSSGAFDPFADTAPMIEMLVQVETVYKDVHSEVAPGQIVLLRSAARDGFFYLECPDWILELELDPYDSVGSTPGTIGDAYLYALIKTSDGISWSTLSSPLNRLSMAEPEVTTSGCPPAKIGFTISTTPTAFIAEMLDVIDQ